MRRLNRLALPLLLAGALGVAGCTVNDSASDRDRQPHVYGGVSGGMVRP